jgi:hypothetical protein
MSRWIMLEHVLGVVASWGQPCLVSRSLWGRYGWAGLPPAPTCGPRPF